MAMSSKYLTKGFYHKLHGIGYESAIVEYEIMPVYVTCNSFGGHKHNTALTCNLSC